MMPQQLLCEMGKAVMQRLKQSAQPGQRILRFLPEGRKNMILQRGGSQRQMRLRGRGDNGGREGAVIRLRCAGRG